ncbi:MAG: FAD-dependent oxidoreductase, partial [Litorimonas sp.]
HPPVLFDPDHRAASANPAALVKPRLDLQDKPAARFFLSSYLYALDAYREAILHRGVTHLPRDAREAERLARLAAQDPLGPGHLRWTGDRLEIDSALVIDPEAARARFLEGTVPTARRIGRLSEVDGPVILAGGYGVRTLLEDSGFRFARGQLSWANGTLDRPVTYGGYAVPMGGRLLLGATHDRIEDPAAAFDLRPDDDARNREQALSHGLDVGPGATSGRASVRVNSPDTLPRLFRFAHEKTGQDVWVLSGLGSRGFVFAPLLGEALVSHYLGEPSPLSDPVREAFSRRPG